MTARTQTATGTTAYRWSSNEASDRFAVENPANGEVITTVQGGGREGRTRARGRQHGSPQA